MMKTQTVLNSELYRTGQ